ncbi:twin transmembrane helix small protein [Roseobacter sp. EG26]|uniref:twin transmembrane helix small protein n=1 Tax=Roseobacter sp. EG26 TaxID=3412477 RepID=UPI0026113204|nr:twin transmembrane helix small protein [uncultured Roseobacter sp.]
MNTVGDPLFVLIVLACIAVVIVLMLGLGGFAGGGAFNKKNSNKLMRYRIAAQFVAVCLIVLYVFLRQKGG